MPGKRSARPPASSPPPSAAKRSRCAAPASPPSTSLVARLPPPIFARVLAFALPHVVPAAHSAPQSPKLPVRRLRPVAAVASDWAQAARAVVAEFAASTLDWRLLAAPTDDDVAQLRAKLQRRGERLLDLRLSVAAALRSKDLAVVDWAELLRLCPMLQRLDLRGVPLEHSAMTRILLAASTACRRLEVLVLSKRSTPSKTPKKAIAATYNALCEALESWHVDDGNTKSSRSSRATLKQLTIPSRHEDEVEAPSATLLAVVAEFCPSLEYLDGWKAGYKVDGFVECDEKWYVSPAVWTQFCESTMRSLREFNWAVAPFHDTYFRIFAATQKPNLRRLCLTVSESWSWEDFRLQGENNGGEEEEEEEEEEREKVELPEELVAPPTPDTLSALVKALPRLEQLHVILHSNMEEPGTLDAESFGDAFLTNVANSCPLLRELKLVELSADEGPSAIEAISSEGLLALSRMENLQSVVITGVGGAPLNVFAFVEHWRHAKGQRTVDIGVDQGESERTFYDEVLDLLSKTVEAFSLNDTDEVSASVPKFAVRIRNLTTAPDFKPKSLKMFCKALNKLVREIDAKVPWMRVAVESDGVLEEGPVLALSTIGQVVMSSRDADLAVIAELNVLAPAASAAPAKAKSIRLNSVDHHSSHEMSSSSESDDGSGYGSVAEDASESSTVETNSEEEEEEEEEEETDSPAKVVRHRRRLASESDEVSDFDSPSKVAAVNAQQRAASDSDDEPEEESFVDSEEKTHRSRRSTSDSEVEEEDSLVDDSPAKSARHRSAVESELSFSVEESGRSADDTNDSIDVVSVDSE